MGEIGFAEYQYQLTLGGFRSPSVQLYRCGDTVKAQLALIKDMLNESDILFTSLTAEGKQNILSAIEEIENGSENPSSALQKKAYCASAVSALNGLKNTVSASFTAVGCFTLASVFSSALAINK